MPTQGPGSTHHLGTLPASSHVGKCVYAYGSHLALVGPTLDMVRSSRRRRVLTLYLQPLHVPSVGTHTRQSFYSSTASTALQPQSEQYTTLYNTPLSGRSPDRGVL